MPASPMPHATARPARLPARAGPRPRTTTRNPHSQIDQPADPVAHGDLLAVLRAMPGVEIGASLRAPPGTVGFFVPTQVAHGGRHAFLLGHEFAHVHPLPEGSLHLTLPPGVREAAIAAGWAEPHPMAGLPTVSPLTVMVYAPRDAGEAAVIAGLVETSRAFAAGEAS